MPLTHSPERADELLTARALRTIRERLQLDQTELGARVGVRSATISNYELGKRSITDERLSELIKALGLTVDEFEEERAALLGAPADRVADPPPFRGFVIPVWGRVRAGPLGPEVYDVGEPLRNIDLRQVLGRQPDALQVAGDSMFPWAEPGEIVLFDRDAYPKRGAGCVVEMKGGEAYVKLYERQDGSTLFVKELYPQERLIPFDLRDVKGVYAVRLRGD